VEASDKKLHLRFSSQDYIKVYLILCLITLLFQRQCSWLFEIIKALLGENDN
jgi:hypothetical protein